MNRRDFIKQSSWCLAMLAPLPVLADAINESWPSTEVDWWSSFSPSGLSDDEILRKMEEEFMRCKRK